MNGLNLSSRGFSVEFTIQATDQNSFQKILEETSDKFTIAIQDRDGKIAVEVDS